MAEQNERQLDIRIDVTPAGLHITASYTGGLSTIPAAIERLRALGVVDLVAASAPPPVSTAVDKKPRAEKVAPAYSPGGEALCPVHRRQLSEGQFGLYCSAKAKGDEVADKRGYCGLKFSE